VRKRPQCSPKLGVLLSINTQESGYLAREGASRDGCYTGLQVLAWRNTSGCLSYMSLDSAPACALCRHMVLPVVNCLPCMRRHGRSHACADTAVCKRLGHIVLCYLATGAAAAPAAREPAA